MKSNCAPVVARLSLLLSLLGAIAGPARADEPLPQDPTASASSPFVLKGKVERKRRYQSIKLKSGAEDGATNEDLEESKEIGIEWDRWRNKFARAIWKRTNQKLAGGDAIMIGRYYIKYGNNPKLDFPQGVMAEVACDITSDRRVNNVRVVSSTGVSQFTQLVVSSFEELNSKSVLEFPKGSQRQCVSMNVTMKMGTGQFHETKFDDVEKVRFTARN